MGRDLTQLSDDELEAAIEEAKTRGSWTDPYVGQGAMFGTGDEVKARIQSMVKGTPYDTELENSRGDLEAYRARHPVLSPILEGAGMLHSAITPVGRVVGGALGPGATMVRSGLAALGAGGFYGFNTGEDGLLNRGINAAKNAVIAGPIGAASVPVGNLIGKGIGWAVSKFRPSEVPSELKHVANAFEQDGVTPADIQELGPEGMLLDAGDNLTQVATGIARSPGEGQKVIRGALRTRDQTAGARVKGAADRALGPSANLPQTVLDITAKQEAAATPAYTKAWAVKVTPTNELTAFLATPAGKRALKEAGVLAANERQPIAGMTDMRAWDYIKRALDDQIEEAEVKKPEMWRALVQLKQGLLRELDGQNPDYATARSIFAGPETVKRAYANGEKVFNNSVSPDQLTIDLAGLSVAEREAYLQAARGQVAKIMGTARKNATAAQREFEREWNQDKLRILVGDTEADAMLATLNQEGRHVAKMGRVMQNSVTSDALASMKNQGIGTAANRYGDAFVMGGFTGPLRQGGRDTLNSLIDAFAGRNTAARQAAEAKALTAKGPDLQALIAQLQNRRQSIAQSSARGKAIEDLLAVLTQRAGISLAPQAYPGSQ